MNDSDWNLLDKEIFDKCVKQMTYQDFLVTETFDAKKSMNALVVGSERLDAHVIQGYIHDISDAAKSGAYLPDENITNEEMKKILGYLFDCQVARFAGNSLFQTILTCIYIHKDYIINNVFFLNLIKAVTASIVAVENFAAIHFPYDSPIWSFIEDSLDYFKEFNYDDVLEYFNKIKGSEEYDQELVNFALYELQFANYINNYLTVPPPMDFSILDKSEPIGFFAMLHYRDLPTHTPPGTMIIPEHTQSIKIFTDMMSLIKSFETYAHPKTTRDLICDFTNWGLKNKDSIALPRIILFATIFPNGPDKLIFSQPIQDFLIEEFLLLHIPKQFFDTPKSPTYRDHLFSDHIYSFVYKMLRSALMPPSIAYSTLSTTLCKSWAMIQRYSYGLQTENLKSSMFPRTNNENYTEIISNPMSLWGLYAAAEIARLYFEIGIDTDIYNVNDYAGVFIGLNSVYKTLTICKQKQDLINACFKLNSRQKKKHTVLKMQDIKREFQIENPEELELVALADFMEGNFHMMRFCDKTQSMKFKRGVYYKAERTYKSRISSLLELHSVLIMPPENFSILYNFDNISSNKLKADAIRKWNDSKESISKTVSMRGEKTPVVQTLLRCIVMSSIALSKWKEGDQLKISFNRSFPTFSLVAQ